MAANAEGPEGTQSSSTGDALNRRRVLTGAVWSVPVMATAMAAPAYAASPGCVGTFSFSPTTLVGGVPRFVANTAYTSPLTITKTGGSATSTIRVTLTGTGFSFEGGGTTRDIVLVGGSATVQIVATAGTGTGNLAVQGLAQTQACPVTNLPLGRRTLTYESNFGLGFYPNTVNGLVGRSQYDTANGDKFHRILGTVAGDVVSNIVVETGITTGWPTTAFTPVAGSNPSWTTPVATGATFQAVAGGVSRTFRVYRFTYTGTVVATGATTNIPIGFYFRQLGITYVANQFSRTTRYATVNGTPVTLTRAVAEIINTNTVTPPSP
ncbi:hypothetical protein HDC34_001070 [Pseudoclavibacter sp. JAI123]|uniref:hypothetical protein n=1 Tax=Pseudoclavibacter sp. JAI123 TaxID=2723065 RepID=UPI0015CA5B16|nr:hypothetical protein [Pseudoclavibacter sp. JAI123]NYF12776.1 hypothetical protein [Pseudoclavibacter sp. JAI123]